MCQAYALNPELNLFLPKLKNNQDCKKGQHFSLKTGTSKFPNIHDIKEEVNDDYFLFE